MQNDFAFSDPGMSETLQPVVFLSHGGGPSFFMSKAEFPAFKAIDKDSKAADYLRNMVKLEKLPHPKAILVVSAHWEERHPTVMTNPSPPLYFDYYGFPSNTYKLKWPSPGAPESAERTRQVLEARGFTCGADEERGFDHGVFVPLLLMYPKADIPVFQLSLMSSLSMEKHLDLGEALSDLRKEGILIIGSGFTTHGKNMIGDDGPPAPWVLEYQKWLHDILKNPDYSREDKRRKLIGCVSKQEFPKAHPRIEHFLPIALTLAAAGYTAPRIAYSEIVSTGGILEHYVYSD
ncbi:4,5-DOPA dioxygenase extradiol-like isoform X2 [Haliotis rubra]|uniref:4,5-DOPA dioxygenase extradiol-like isoform X2 n=1 Tax=Haliotis rubra TaxID=36100 RepID=UPI001EE59BC3|nr:4,5-DOPA dioxygenase extradiol-like isoform X2 [Haliotis rubra]